MTDFVQLVVAGLSLGSIYALICLAFVVVYRATGVLNFALGGLVVLGAYVTFQFGVRWGFPFPVAVLAAALVLGAVGLLIERFVLRRMVGQPVFAVILITLGLLFVLEQICTTLWGYDLQMLGDPWGLRTVMLAGATIKLLDLWTIGASAVALTLVFIGFRFTTVGVAMRAAASDPEAALAHGVNPRTVHGIVWALAGVLAVVAGVFLTAGPRGIDLTVSLVALRAFPAAILGGLDSTEGAVAGGLIVGLAEVMSAAYITPNAPWLGANIHTVMPYLLMILVLLVRPYGLFGTPEVRRA
ncbi:MAG: branched-chain amino acid ABC transporter permease [Gemmatimonadales bacterium]|nr:branched-chain amino acid ABC transporter permease [Gemmatimonadales bacterium]